MRAKGKMMQIGHTFQGVFFLLKNKIKNFLQILKKIVDKVFSMLYIVIVNDNHYH